MDRRTLLMGMGAALAASASGLAHAEHTEDHEHHHHHMSNRNDALIDSASHCVTRGEICLDHCHDLLAEGDKAMAACARSVNEMLAICGALQNVAAQDAPSLKKMAAIAADTCQRCEDECKKHASKHPECKDCGEACAACRKECLKIAA